jgi:poly(A) polymerase
MATRQIIYDWMLASDIRRIIDVFARAGAEIRFIGGCVRDSLLDREVRDVDIATDALPDSIVEILRDAGIKSIPTGIEHGTVTAIVEGRAFEITTYRRDIKTDGRHAVVEFGTDWREDAERRDFTINAMSITPDGNLHDPFDGVGDLAEGRVRFVGDAQRRVREDILRILRWFRFHAHYGKSPPDADALGACRGFAFRIPDLSGERIRHELLRLLAADNPMPSIKLMVETDVIDAVLGRGWQTERLAGLCAIERQINIPTDSLLRLAALIVSPGMVVPLARRLRLSSTEQKRLLAVLSTEPSLGLGTLEVDRARIFYRLGSRIAEDRILLAWAANPTATAWREWLEALRFFDAPEFPLSGRDVMAEGLAAGPAVGDVLRQVEDWWIAAGFSPSRAQCLAQLKEMLGT